MEKLQDTLTARQAAEYLGMSHSTVRRASSPKYRASGEYPLTPLKELYEETGTIRFSKEELNRWRAIERKPGRRYSSLVIHQTAKYSAMIVFLKTNPGEVVIHIPKPEEDREEVKRLIRTCGKMYGINIIFVRSTDGVIRLRMKKVTK